MGEEERTKKEQVSKRKGLANGFFVTLRDSSLKDKGQWGRIKHAHRTKNGGVETDELSNNQKITRNGGERKVPGGKNSLEKQGIKEGHDGWI